MTKMVWISIGATYGLFITALIIVLFKEGLIEISPKRAVVYKNLWTGEAHALLPGTHLIIPGIHKRLPLEITLENEPSDPQIVKSFTNDGAEIGVDFVVFTQKIVEDKDETAVKNAIVKAATAIDYKNRNTLILSRIKAFIQDMAITLSLEDIVKDGKLDAKKLKEIEDHINDSLLKSVKEEWGFDVDVQIENIQLPEKAKEVVEEAATAEKEGARIKTKADKAGVDPRWIVAGDMVYDAIRALKGGG